MATHDFITGQDDGTVRAIVRRTLEGQGFTVTENPARALVAKRGNEALSWIFGAMAGKAFAMTFTVSFMVDQEGRLVVRLNHDGSVSAVKGGAIGYAKVKKAYGGLVDIFRTELTSAGQLSAELEA